MIGKITLNAAQTNANLSRLYESISIIADNLELSKEEGRELQRYWEGRADNIWFQNFENQLTLLGEDCAKLKKLIGTIEESLMKLNETRAEINDLLNGVGI